ncbi:hypothetical protein EN852_034020 [Mesorhizobium sp. M2E.F.Ca.ET.209.01.1.1]|uniref:hypothetical protein n=1 Tax=Mesorhizobium sp. M2E.F.Ca.ET.209.01.1.1 TaxID=2500526 RepID=UPI000FD7814D|nr:hypothetical protein [Mesorhizobium sp. M2E.F.Ca.ET.209.01.1.1]TGS08722.1 hypothetical protein EN852_034020 [Mesorhizobium sp. M2E.F.Ca.ET.209.01.1.1]
MEDSALLIFQTLGTAGTLAAGIAAWLTAREMHKQSKNSVRPHPVLVGRMFEQKSPFQHGETDTFLDIENVGQGPMLDVSITWDLDALLKSMPINFTIGRNGTTLEYKVDKGVSFYMLGSVINFNKSHIQTNEGTKVRIPHVVVHLTSEIIHDNFKDNTFDNFDDSYLFAKIKFKDVFENTYIYYYKITLSLISFERGNAESSFRAEWKVLQSQHLEL